MFDTLNSADDRSHNLQSANSGKQQTELPDKLLRKLLLVDDEADGAEFAATLLSAHGLQVIVVHSAREALHALQSDKEIDAVLSDVMMPGMSGLQLAEEIRVRHPTVKIVLMSGHTLPDLLKDHEQPYLFATKPYRIETILNLLHS